MRLSNLSFGKAISVRFGSTTVVLSTDTTIDRPAIGAASFRLETQVGLSYALAFNSL